MDGWVSRVPGAAFPPAGDAHGDADGGAIVTEPMTGAETGDGAGEPIDFALIEALFFAYRDFISSADRELAAMGFGRAHHRVLHFVNRQPGLSVAELLEPLAITKQSLARVLRQLVDAGLIVQCQHRDDRRQRHLYPTRAGRELTLALAEPQSRRIARALRGLGEERPHGGPRAMVDPRVTMDPRAFVLEFLEGMIEASDGAANGET